MKIIDFHTHIYPNRIAEKASQATGNFYGIKPSFNGTSEELLSVGRKAGISRFVLLPVATKSDNVRHINKFICDEVATHDKFYGFGTLHADCDNLFDETDFIIKSGMRGIKLHPDTQGFNTDDKRLFEIFDYIQGKIPLLIHCGDKRFDFSHPRRLKNEDCYLDISSTMMFLPQEQVEHYIHSYGADRILFGTDYPLWNPVKEVASFKTLHLTYGEYEKIAYKNALEILVR